MKWAPTQVPCKLLSKAVCVFKKLTVVCLWHTQAGLQFEKCFKYVRSPLRVRVPSTSWLRMAAMTGSSPFRIKCGNDGFYLDLLDLPHQPSTGDVCRARVRVSRVSYTGDNFASMLSVSTSGFSRKCPTAAVVIKFL